MKLAAFFSLTALRKFSITNAGDVGGTNVAPPLIGSSGVRVVQASPDLWALLDLCGLRDAVRQPEQREQSGRVEEERHLADLPVADLDDL